MSRATTKPLPANLPPLPEPPAGFNGWEYMGMGYHSFVPVVYACPNSDRSGWGVSKGKQVPFGFADEHYIVAVKRPAKASAAKKPKKPEHKAGRVVAVKTWQLGKTTGPECRPYHAATRAFVLPADAASVERMVEQAASALAIGGGGDKDDWRKASRAALAAIGIAATGKGARK